MEDRSDLSDILLNGLDEAERRHVRRTIRSAHQMRLEHLRRWKVGSTRKEYEPAKDTRRSFSTD